jgi:hypothetical protein
VDLVNRGQAPIAGVAVEGELRGERDQARLGGPLPPGATGSVRLHYAAVAGRPGTYLLALSLDELGEQGSVISNQRGYLLPGIGAHPPAVVRVSASDAVLRDVTELPLRIESVDGAPHRVRFRVLAPRGLRAEPEEAELEVPASGAASTRVRLRRGEVPRGSRPGVVVAVASRDGEQETTAVTSAVVTVAPDPAWLPRLRTYLIVIAIALLTAAVSVEMARLWPARP